MGIELVCPGHNLLTRRESHRNLTYSINHKTRVSNTITNSGHALETHCLGAQTPVGSLTGKKVRYQPPMPVWNVHQKNGRETKFHVVAFKASYSSQDNILMSQRPSEFCTAYSLPSPWSISLFLSALETHWLCLFSRSLLEQFLPPRTPPNTLSLANSYSFLCMQA